MAIKRLYFTTAYQYSSWTTRLTYGAEVLIEARDLRVDEAEGGRRSMRWFCEELGFLACEFRARERVPVETDWWGMVRAKKSRVVRLNVGKRGFGALREVGKGGVGKVVRLKLRFRA